jgi:hypothetical protein
MDEKQAAALRKPFLPAQIGKLPKGGAMLDFVGHAAATDRLLQVDPEWNWEPMAYDMGGLPLLDANHNLWIKLTICGVTRIGVGDGKSLKELIGDAIRNAAMRFGVALDLWAKEDLHAMAEPRQEPQFTGPAQPAATRTMSRQRPPQTGDAASSRDASPGLDDSLARGIKPTSAASSLITKLQLAKLHILLQEHDLGERETALKFLSGQVGRTLTSSKELTRAEASRLIDAESPSPEPPFEGEPS